MPQISMDFLVPHFPMARARSRLHRGGALHFGHLPPGFQVVLLRQVGQLILQLGMGLKHHTMQFSFHLSDKKCAIGAMVTITILQV